MRRDGMCLLFIAFAVIGVIISVSTMHTVEGKVDKMEYEKRYDGEETVTDYYVWINNRRYEVDYYVLYSKIAVGDSVRLWVSWGDTVWWGEKV